MIPLRHIIRAVRTYLIFSIFLLTYGISIQAQDCLEYPEIEGTPCVGCTPEGWTGTSGTTPDIIEDDGSWPGGGCTIEDLSGGSPGGGNMSLFVSQGGGYQEGMTTTMSGLNPGQEYGFGLYWEMVSTQNCGFFSGGDLVIIIDGEEFVFSDAEDWEFIEICFTPSSESIEIFLHIEGDDGSGAGSIVVDSPSCEEVTPCCPLYLELEEEEYELCPGEEIVFEGFYAEEEGDVSIEWTSDPSDGVNYLDDPNIMNPTFLVDEVGEFEEESYIFTVTIEDDNCIKSLELEVNVGASIIPEFDIYLCEIFEDPDFPLESLNGYTGFWTGNFNIDELGGTVQEYTFTLDPGQDNCIEEWTYEIAIDQAEEVTFDIPLSYCVLDDTRYRLDSESEENIDGNWDDNRIDPSDLGVGVFIFTFFPDTEEHCAFPFELEIEVYDADSLSFDIPTSFCLSQDSLILPNQSLEMIFGEWEEDIIYFDEPGVFSIEFEPEEPLDCYHPYLYTYTVSGSVQNTFDLPESICDSSAEYVFPSVSMQGYEGVWDPPSVLLDTLNSNQISSVWTSMDSAQQCISEISATINVESASVLDFTIPDSLCSDYGMYILPDTSLNAYSGNWNVDTLNTEEYSNSWIYLSFEANSDCTVLYEDSVFVEQNLMPVFSFPISLCKNEPSFSLPVTSDNGVIGIWSQPDVDPSMVTDSLQLIFTPEANSGQCAESTELTIYAGDIIQAEFNIPAQLCYNELINFPAISINGVEGSWEEDLLDPQLMMGGEIFSNVFTPDNTDCYQGVEIQIEILNFDQITVSTQDPVSCSSSDGFIEIDPGNGNFEYSLDQGMSWTSLSIFDNLADGNYELLARSQSDSLCIEAYELTLSSPSGPIILDLSKQDITNCTDDNGSVICDATGEDLEFSIDGGTTWQTDEEFTSLAAGSYTLIVRSNGDSNCSVSESFEIIAFQETIIENIQSQDPSDCSNNDGSIEIVASGDNLEYSIDNGINWQLSPLFEDLDPGQYNIIVRSQNANDCQDQSELNIIANEAPLILDLIGTGLSDCGQMDASIEVVFDQYSGDLEFSIDNGVSWQTNNLFSDLGAGIYTVLIQDPEKLNCNDSRSIEIVDASIPEILKTIITQPSDCVSSDAIVELEIEPAGMEVSIDGGISWQSSLIFSDLAEGDYTILVRNPVRNSCTDQTVVRIINPPCPCEELQIEFSVQDADCLNPLGGSIEITSIDGFSTTLPYEFMWENGEQSLILEGLSEDWYSFVINYDKNCSLSDSIYVDSYEPIDFDLISFDQDCQGLGSIEVINLTGGTGQLQYSIDGFAFQDSSVFFNLSAADYEILVQDLFNCGSSESTTINDNSDLKLELNPVLPIELGQSTILNPLINESSLDDWEWSPTEGILNPGELVIEVAPEETTEYTLTIYFGDCVETRTIIVEVIDPRDIYLGNIFDRTSLDNRVFYIQGPEDLDVSIESFQILDRWGNLVFENNAAILNDPSTGWDGYFNNSKAVPGVYVYIIEYTLNGESQIRAGSITLIQ